MSYDYYCRHTTVPCGLRDDDSSCRSCDPLSCVFYREPPDRFPSITAALAETCVADGTYRGGVEVDPDELRDLLTAYIGLMEERL